MPTTAATDRSAPHGVGGVLLVSTVGFASGWVPLGIALLKSYLTRTTGHPVETLSLCVTFSRHLAEVQPGLVEYDSQMGEWGSSFHELYFAARYFGHADAAELVRESVRDLQTGGDIFRAADWEAREPLIEGMVTFETARRMTFCRLVDEFSSRAFCEALEVQRPWLIGFSVTAQQIFSAAILARLARQLSPEATLVMGGPAVTAHSAGKLLELFSEVDCVVYGDGELPLRALVEARAADIPLRDIPGVLCREAGGHTCLQPAPSPALDEIPTPDYAEIRNEIIGLNLPLTTWMGRGCSWGRCEFCAIPDFQRRTRNRSPERIYDDLVRLHTEYGVRKFRFGDWEINGDPAALMRLCDLLASGGHDFEFWAEVNARRLSPELMHALQRAGMVRLQVGLEAFSASLLKKMNKPATILDNVQALLYAHQFGVSLFSNLLFNFPGETREEVIETLAVVRRLRHLLRPPVDIEIIEFLLEVDADIARTLPNASAAGPPYRFESRCLPDDREDGTLFFLRSWKQQRHAEWIQVHHELRTCREREPTFTHALVDGAVHLHDTRQGSPAITTLSGVQSRVYRELIGRKRSVRQLLADIRSDLSEADLTQCLSEFVQAEWVLNDGPHWLALSLPGDLDAGRQ